MELMKVDSVDAALEKLLRCARDWLPAEETVPLNHACSRILSKDLFAGEDLPPFRRSTMDGYAVVAADTAAAGESLPVFLTLKGQVEMGKAPGCSIQSGECAEVPTGGMLPEGADAVVMVEYSEPFGGDGIALYHGAAAGENVVRVGEETRAGALLLRRGARIRAQEIGALAASGHTVVPVYKPPRLFLISTGDELVPPERSPLPGQVRDVNTHMLRALAEKDGFQLTGIAVVRDEEQALESAVRAAMETSDIVAISGGSSKGQKDATSKIIDRVSKPGVFTHGLAIKPGKPTILGFDERSHTLLAGLPGHPVSAMMVFELTLGWLMRELTGCPLPPAIPARLAVNVPSSPGKLTCIPAALHWTGEGYEAEPVFGKSGLITALAGADGYFTIERNREGLSKGDTVLVHLF